MVLSRRDMESLTFRLPDNSVIVVTIVETKPGRAILSISAPREVSILRTELIERDKANGWDGAIPEK